LGNDRARGRAEADAELARHDLRERRLAEPRRAMEQDMVERLAAASRRGDENSEIGAELRLADEIVERQRPQRRVHRIARPNLGGDEPALAHALSSLRPARTRDSTVAALPSCCAACATAPKASPRR